MLFLLFAVVFYGSCDVDWSKLTSTTLAALDPVVFLNVSSANISVIPGTACTGFRADQVRNIGPESFSGFLQACLKNFPSQPLQAITASQIATVQTSQIALFTGSWLTDLSPAAIGGFTVPQVVAFSGSACSYFGGSFLTDVNPTSYFGFQSACFAKIPSSSYTGVTAAGIGNVDPNQTSGIGQYAMDSIPQTAANFTVEAVANFSPTTGCRGLSKSVFTGLPPASYAGFTMSCLAASPSTAWVGVTATGVPYFTPDACVGIRQYAMDSIPQSAANFNAEQVKKFDPTTGCAGISTQIFRGLPALAYSGFRSACLGKIPYSAYAGCSAAGVGNFDPTQTGGIGNYAMDTIPQASANFSAAAIMNFGITTGCKGISRAIFAGLPAESYSGFRSACLNSAPYAAYAGCFAGGIANLDPTQTGGIGNYGMDTIPQAAANGFTPSAVSNFSAADGCRGISLKIFAGLKAGAYAGFQSACLNRAPYSAYAGCYAAGINNFEPVQVAGIGNYAMDTITKAAAEGFTAEQVANFNSTTGSGCAGVSSRIMSGMMADAYAGWKKECLARVPYSAYGGCHAAGVGNFVSTEVFGISNYGMDTITEAAANFTIDSVRNFNPDTGCKGISVRIMSGLPVKSYGGFQKRCLASIPYTAWRGATMEKIAEIPANVIGGITSYGMDEIPASAYYGFTSAQARNFENATNCRGISAQGLSNFTQEAFTDISAGCIASTSSPAWGGLLPSQVPWLSIQQCTGLTLAGVSYLNNDTVVVFTVGQLMALQHGRSNNSAQQGFNHQHLYLLYKTHGIAMLTLYTYYFPSRLDVVVQFKKYFLDTVASVAPKLTPVLNSLSTNPTWYEFTFLEDNVTIASDFFLKNPEVLAGLRAGQLPNIPKEVFTTLDALTASFLYADTLAALRQDQIQAIPPTAFAGIALETFDQYPGNQVPLITNTQIYAFTEAHYPYVFKNMPCPMIFNFTDAQINNFYPQSKSLFEDRKKTCSGPAPPAPRPPVPGPVPVPGPAPVPGPHTPTPSGNNNLGPIIGGVVGGLAGVIIVSLIAFYIVRRNRRTEYVVIS